MYTGITTKLHRCWSCQRNSVCLSVRHTPVESRKLVTKNSFSALYHHSKFSEN